MNNHPKDSSRASSSNEGNALPIWVYLVCGWPIALVAFGGLIGGLLGGLAMGVNLAIWKSSMPPAAKFVLIPLVGFASVGIWLAVFIGLDVLRGLSDT